MQKALNISRPNDHHFNKRSKGGLRNDEHTSRNRFPQVFYAIGNTHTTAFRFDVNSGILCEKLGNDYLPVIAFQPRFENAGQAFKWASVYASKLQDWSLLGRCKPSPLRPIAYRDAQCQADLAVFGKAQIS